MATAPAPARMFVGLALTVLLAGCAGMPPPFVPADGAAFRGERQAPAPPPAPPRKAEETTAAVRPPRPAPALYIPGPPLPSAHADDVETLPIAVQFQEPAQPKPMPVQTVAMGQQRAAQAAASPLRELARKAAQRTASLESYIMRLRRREVVNGQKRPEELLLCKFRKEPWSVYFKWIGPEAHDREVTYVKGRSENVIHTLTAAGDILFVPAGKHIKVAPDSVIVKSKTRYPITDAGIGPLVERFGRMVDAAEKGDNTEGVVKYLGQLKRPEFEGKLEAVLQVLPPRLDPNLPRGGQRHWFFDTTYSLPLLIITQDDSGREVEYYLHDRFMLNVKLDDDDFNPEKLWKTATP